MQRKGDIVSNGHVGEKRVILKDHAKPALLWLNPSPIGEDHLLIQGDLASLRHF